MKGSCTHRRRVRRRATVRGMNPWIAHLNLRRGAGGKCASTLTFCRGVCKRWRMLEYMQEYCKGKGKGKGGR